MYYSVSQVAFLLGVCNTTIRRWDKQGLIRCIRTPGNDRRIHRDEITRIIAGKKRRYKKKKRGVAIYGRVSSHEQKQKRDLKRLLSRLRENVKNKRQRETFEISCKKSWIKETFQISTKREDFRITHHLCRQID